MSKRFTIETVEIDPEKFSKIILLLIRIRNVILPIFLMALDKFLCAFKQNPSVKIPKLFFTKKYNFIFNQLTYHHYDTLLRRIFLPFHDKVGFVYINNSLIFTCEIKEMASGKEIKNALDKIQKTTEDLRAQKHAYRNDMGLIIKPVIDHKVKIHSVIIQKYKGILPLKSNLYFTQDAHGITHLFPEKDYYFVINRLVTPTEFHHYLNFRAELFLERKINVLYEISEASLLGCYLLQEKSTLPDNKHAHYAINIDVGLDQWKIILNSLHSLSIGLSHMFEERYCLALTHIAKLRLNELTLFRDKFMFHYRNKKDKVFTHKNEIDMSLPFGFIFFEHYQKEAQEDFKKFKVAVNSYRYQHKLTYCICLIFTLSQTHKNRSHCDVIWHISASEHLIDE